VGNYRGARSGAFFGHSASEGDKERGDVGCHIAVRGLGSQSDSPAQRTIAWLGYTNTEQER